MGEEKRLSAEQLDEALDGMYAMETRRADEAEAIVRAHIAALEAEIASLKPSGQVADDLSVVSGERPATREAKAAAIVRLAAKAQGYEAMEERCKVEITKAITAESERDAAVADNAALVHVLAGVWRKVAAMHYEGLGLKEAIDAAHPGTALLEQHRKDVEGLRAIVDGLASEMERTLKHREQTGGMRVPDHGDFASAPPSMLGRMRWWVREMRAALGGSTSALLVRARNGGLEDVAKECITKRDSIMREVKPGTRRGGLEEAASIARAMKEPEQ